MTPYPVRHNPREHRFETVVENRLAVLTYRRNGHEVIITHTLVPPELENRGIGSALAKAALDYARQNHLSVIPACSFVGAYIARHREYGHLVVPDGDG